MLSVSRTTLLRGSASRACISSVEKDDNIKSKATILVLIWTLIFPSVIAFGQGKEFQVKKLKQYWRDEHEQPWNDLSYRWRLDSIRCMRKTLAWTKSLSTIHQSNILLAIGASTAYSETRREPMPKLIISFTRIHPISLATKSN